MPRKITEAELDYFARLYNEGKTLREIGEIGKWNPDTIGRHLRNRGIDTNGRRSAYYRPRIDLPDAEIITAFNAGASVNELATRFSVSRNVIDVRLRNAGIQPRGQSEAERVKWARMPASQRAKHAERVRQMFTGKSIPLASKVRKARTKAAKGHFDSPYERKLYEMLTERGLTMVPQMAVGPYNCDLGTSAVAVEVFSGNWHWYGRHLARLNERVDYFFDAALNVLIVQRSSLFPITSETADYVAAYVEAASRRPAAWREYRVIRGAGELLAVARSDRDDRTLVPAFAVPAHRRG